MASQNIYAPTVNSYEPAFNYMASETEKGKCTVYFTLSDYNIRSDVEYVHASVVKASTNKNVINTSRNYEEEDILTNAGIILNLPIVEVSGKQGLYSVEIDGEYIYDNAPGWDLGSIYKMQLRLTKEKCASGDAKSQVAWININANLFSEWSTTITTKAIGDDSVDIPILMKDPPFTSSNLDIIGTYTNTDDTEKMYSAKITLYDEDGGLLEESGELYKDSFDTSSKFSYSFKTNLDTATYKINITITTQNKHIYSKDYIIDAEPVESPFLKDIYLKLSTHMKGYEEDEGCLMMQVYSDNPDEVYQGTLRIRRASAEDNFLKWEDVYEIICEEETKVSDIKEFTDFTVESGVYYKYGLQEISKDSEGRIIRSKLKITDEVRIVFEYSFLFGAGGRQLKLMYDNTVKSFQKTYSDVVTPTIGGRYPFVTRVGNSDYYTFQLSGKISFSMDENHLFLAKDFLYGYSSNNMIDQYDRTYERAFRNEVYSFLTDGKPKLFKSPTEGNILIRISNVSLSPEQSLSRLIYSFSANATEIDDATIEKYQKYNFIKDYNDSLLL